MQGNQLKTNDDLIWVNKDDIMAECTYESLYIISPRMRWNYYSNDKRYHRSDRTHVVWIQEIKILKSTKKITVYLRNQCKTANKT